MNNRLVVSARAIIVLGSVIVVPTTSVARSSTVAGLKTAGACNDEYKANKGALKDAKESKKDFITACRTLAPGVPTPIGAPPAQTGPAPTAPAPVPSPSRPQTTRAPTSAPAQPSSVPSGDVSGYAHAPSNPTAVQFTSEAGAKAHCPSGTVVWVNTKSGVYHYAAQRNYGHTKTGAFECEADAKAENDRPTKNGQ